MKWEKVSEYPLPEGDGEQWYILKLILSNDEIVYRATTSPEDYDVPTIVVVEFCEFNPDEIDGDDQKFYSKSFLDNPELIQAQREENEKDSARIKKSATEVFGKIEAEHQARLNQALYAKRMIEDPSWEEKFRWETARAFHIARHTGTFGFESVDSSIEYADDFIEHLKRGRE